jgi:hypothetical protein
LFLYFKAKGYYAIGLYPVLIAFGAVYLEKVLSGGWVKYLKIVVILPILAIIPLFQVVVPILPPEKIIKKNELFDTLGLLRWEDGKNHALPQDFADMLGWKELAGYVDKAYENLNNVENTLIHCDNYGQAGAINFYSKQKYSEAVSMNADYINWYELDEMEIKTVILVIGRPRFEVVTYAHPLFEQTTYIGSISNEFAREFGTAVFLLQKPKQNINQLLREEINSRTPNN